MPNYAAMDIFEEKKGNTTYAYFQRTVLGIPVGKKYYFGSIEDMGSDLFKQTVYNDSIENIKKTSYFRREGDKQINVGDETEFYSAEERSIKHYDFKGHLLTRTIIAGEKRAVETYRYGSLIQEEVYLGDQLVEKNESNGTEYQKVTLFSKDGSREVREYFGKRELYGYRDGRRMVISKYDANNHLHFVEKRSFLVKNGVLLTFSELKEDGKEDAYTLSVGSNIFLKENTKETFYSIYMGALEKEKSEDKEHQDKLDYIKDADTLSKKKKLLRTYNLCVAIRRLTAERRKTRC